MPSPGDETSSGFDRKRILRFAIREVDFFDQKRTRRQCGSRSSSRPAQPASITLQRGTRCIASLSVDIQVPFAKPIGLNPMGAADVVAFQICGGFSPSVCHPARSAGPITSDSCARQRACCCWPSRRHAAFLPKPERATRRFSGCGVVLTPGTLGLVAARSTRSPLVLELTALLLQMARRREGDLNLIRH
jgi:hypothetical protein